MGHFLTIALSFPSVVYTVMLGVALFYWIFVMVGAAHVNLLGDGAADGAMDGAFEGGADHLEGALHGGHGADGIDGGAGHDADVDVDVDGAGGTSGLIAALKLRSAPATVVLSTVILFSWLFNVIGMQVVESTMMSGGADPGTNLTLAKVALLLLSPIVALLPTSVVVRPLARVFTPPVATKHESLVGKLCTVRTGTVTDKFGEALLEDGGPGVVVRIRLDDMKNQKLRRGDQAVIVAYDPETQNFTVAPMTGLLDDRDEDKARAKAKAKAKARVAAPVATPAAEEEVVDDEEPKKGGAQR